MLKRAIAFLKPPVFPEDEGKSRKALYAHSIALVFSGAAILYELFLRFIRSLHVFNVADVFLFAIAFVGVIVWRLIRRGYVSAASIILVALIWAGTNGIAASGYGIRDSSFIINFVVMLIAALLLGWQAAGFIAVASIATAFGLAYAESRGLIITTIYPVTSFALDISVVLALGAFIIYLLITGLERATRRAEDSLIELQTANRELGQAQSDLHARTVELTATNEILQRRTNRLRIVAEVARTASATQDLDQLLPSITTIMSRELGYYHVGIFLIDESNEYAILRSANTDGGLRMLARGYRVKVGERGIIGFVTQSGTARVDLDTGPDAVSFDNPDLPGTRSELVLPLKVGREIIGAIDIQSTETKAFTEEDVSLMTIMADQVSIAIQNARLFERTIRALHEAEVASSQLTGQAWRGFSETIRAKGYRYDGIKPEPLKKTIPNAEEMDTFTVPVQLRGQTLGRLKLKTSDMARKWTDDELAIIEATAERVALAMDGARLLDDAQKRAKREAFLSELAAKLGASFQLDSILRDTVEELGQTLKGSTVTFQLVNPSAHQPAENENSGPADRMKSE